MGLLRRLFGSGTEPKPGATVDLRVIEFTKQRPEAILEVVGESFYQRDIELLAKSSGAEWRTAFLIAEPSLQLAMHRTAVSPRQALLAVC